MKGLPGSRRAVRAMGETYSYQSGRKYHEVTKGLEKKKDSQIDKEAQPLALWVNTLTRCLKELLQNNLPLKGEPSDQSK